MSSYEIIDFKFDYAKVVGGFIRTWVSRIALERITNFDYTLFKEVKIQKESINLSTR